MFDILDEDFIYWADSDHGTVTRIKRDGTQRKVVVEQYELMENINVDWLTGRECLKLVEHILDSFTFYLPHHQVLQLIGWPGICTGRIQNEM